MNEPNWTAANMNRKQGNTTFKTCGWCEHRACGSYRYDCMIDGGCDLLTRYGNRVDTQWDTKCKVVDLAPGDIKSLIEAKESAIRRSHHTIKANEKMLAALKDIQVPYKPCQPDNRSCDHFKIGESVYVMHENKYNHGTIVPGYRSGDGCVSYVLDDYPDSEGGWGGGYAGPWCITGTEYKYFKSYPKDYVNWMKKCDRIYNGNKLDIDMYLKAMNT